MKRNLSPRKDAQDPQKLPRVISEQDGRIAATTRAAVTTTAVTTADLARSQVPPAIKLPIDTQRLKSSIVPAEQADAEIVLADEEEALPEEDAAEPLVEQDPLDEQDDAEQQRSLSAHLTKESEVGITEYRTPLGNGFTAVLKERITDFMVNEVDLEGNVVRLESLQAPVDKVDKAAAAAAASGAAPASSVPVQVSEEESLQQLETLLGQEKLAAWEAFMSDASAADASFETEPVTDKEKRKEIHGFFKLHFQQKFDTSTTPDSRVSVFRKRRGGGGRGRDNNAGYRHDNRNPALPAQFCRFVLYKESRDTVDAVCHIASALRLNHKLFTYAGTKDRRAITTQLVTANRVAAEKLASFNQHRMQGIRLGNFEYVKKDLRLGDLSGNRFTITLRDVKYATEDEITMSLQALKEHGFINYFGMQRFGCCAILTHEVGIAILKSDWKRAVDLIVSSRDGEIRARQEYLNGNFEAAYQLMGRQCVAERAVLRSLALDGNHHNFSVAVQAIPRNMRLIYVHAYQSFLWNMAVSERIRRYGGEPVVGDLVYSDQRQGKSRDWQERNRVRWIETEEECARYSIADVLLPVIGFGVELPKNSIGDYYRELMDKEQLFEVVRARRKGDDFALPGDYRLLLAKPKDVEWTFRRYDSPKENLAQTDLEKLLATSAPIRGAAGITTTTAGMEKDATSNEEAQEPSLTATTATTATAEPPKERRFLSLTVAFSLGSSQYATMCLREIMKIPTSSAYQKTLNAN